MFHNISYHIFLTFSTIIISLINNKFNYNYLYNKIIRNIICIFIKLNNYLALTKGHFNIQKSK